MSSIPLSHVDYTPSAAESTHAPVTRSHADYVLAPDVLLIPADDGTARLLDLGGDFFSVSEVGAIMLEIVLKRGSEAAVQEVSRHFSADPTQVRVDLVAMLKGFENKKLIRRVSAAKPARRRVRQALAQFLALPVPLILKTTWPLKLKGFALLALARLSCALGGWTATVRAWKQRKNSQALATPCATAPQDVDRAVRTAAAQHMFQVACKERALSCWALAQSAGLNADLVVGIQFFPVAGHCWCEVGDLPISDDRSRISDFRPVARWM